MITDMHFDIIESQLAEIEKNFFQEDTPHDYFLNGKTGLALYYFYRARISEDEQMYGKANTLINEVLDQLGTPGRFYGGSFTLGISGLTSALLIMKEEEFIDFSDQDLAGLDHFVFSWAKEELDIMNTDYLHGAAGALHYFIERAGLGNQGCADMAAELIDIFYRLALKDDQGIRFLNKFYKNRYPEFTNLGVSHGLMGVLLILMKAYEKGIRTELCLEMIEGGMKYLEQVYLDKPFPQSGQSKFFVSKNEETGELQYTDRLAWCYGDLNVALIFSKAGKLLNNEKFSDIGLEIGLETMQRTTAEQTEIRTPFFCHGTSGTAMVYHSLYAVTGENRFLESYSYWKNETYNMLDIDQLKMMSSGVLSFLDGPIGLAFFLLTEQYGQKLKWEKYFLL